jgi:hypothetical protein
MNRYETVPASASRRGHDVTMARVVGVVAVGMAALLLAACAPTSAPDEEPTAGGAPRPSATASPTPAPDPEPPEPPDVLDLALTTEGLGTLRFTDALEGAPTDMVRFDPEFCTDARTGQPYGIAPGSELAGLWVPLERYGTWRAGYTEAPFGVAVEGTTPVRIDLVGGVLATEAGIRMGSSDDEVHAAYPGAAVLEQGLSDVVVVEGSAGRLLIEIARDRDIPGYWDAAQQDHVLSVVAVAKHIPPFARAGTDNWVGGCPV